MFNASIIYFVIHESSFLFSSSVLSSLFLPFSLLIPILLIYLLPSFRHRTERGRERDFNLRSIIKIIRCSAFIIDIRRVLGFTEKKEILNLKLISPSSFLYGTKKLVSERDFDLRLPSESILSFVMMKHSREFV